MMKKAVTSYVNAPLADQEGKCLKNPTTKNESNAISIVFILKGKMEKSVQKKAQISKRAFYLLSKYNLGLIQRCNKQTEITFK